MGCLAFDGDNTYADGPFSVNFAQMFAGDAATSDSYNGDLVTQFLHRALYRISASGNTEFGIVRTGGYTGYGFGGFVYLRNNGVVLPTTGQADYIRPDS